ncbi:MAG: hypothetical protein HQK96_19090, partial [Nitrospirae bacterium]|nr:hypothetical protein [Nitrospirota bacterium]
GRLLLIEAIFKLITWPHVVLVLSLVFIFVFRKAIAGLIGRTTEIGKKGLTAAPSTETQLQKTETDTKAVQQLLDAVGNSIVINEQEEIIKKDLKEKGLSTEGPTVKVLIKHLAVTQLLLAFEYIHSFIFGSQIFLLKKPNEVRGQGSTVEFVKDQIEYVKHVHPEQLGEWSAEKYLAFLYDRSLIVHQGSRIHITGLGVEYLIWIAKSGRREDNPL